MVPAKDLAKFLKRRGFEEQRQTGSHLVLKHPDSKVRLVLPMHGGDLQKGLLLRILKDAGSSLEEFRAKK